MKHSKFWLVAVCLLVAFALVFSACTDPDTPPIDTPTEDPTTDPGTDLGTDPGTDPGTGTGTVPVITTTTLPAHVVNTSGYNAQLAATGTPTITWSLKAGSSLPTGLTLSSAGLISGIPTEIGTFTFTVIATNSAGSDEKELSITITSTSPPPILSVGSWVRTSQLEADIIFTSSKAGTGYYVVYSAGTDTPEADVVAAGTSLGAVTAGENNVTVTGLSAGARDIHIVVTDTENNNSNVLTISVGVFTPPTPDTYTVTIVSTIFNGSISAFPNTGVLEGDVVTITANPNDGYRLEDGSLKYRTLPSGSWVDIEGVTFAMPASNVEVTGTFELRDVNAITYTVTIGSLSKGTITVNPAEYEEGEWVALIVNPSTGYRLVDGSLTYTPDGGTAVPIDGTSFQMPAADVTINAEFEAVSYNIEALVLTHGSITPRVTAANFGDEVILDINPDSGYQLAAITVTRDGGGAVVVSGAGNIYVFTMPASDVIVSGTFTTVSYNVNIASGITHGSVSRSPATGAVGTEITLTVEPNNGYQLKAGTLTVTPAGGGTAITLTQIPSTNQYTFSMPAANVTVTAEFEPASYSINITTPTGGSITSTHESATMGTMVTLTVTANPAYLLNSITATPSSGQAITPSRIGSTNQYRFTMPAANVTVSAVFNALPTYSVSASAPGGNGTVSASPNTGVVAGDTVYLALTPDENYRFLSLSVTQTEGGTAVPFTGSGNNYSFTMPTANVTVTAAFEEIPAVVTRSAVTIASPISNGTISASPNSNVAEGSSVTLTITPDANYRLKAGTLKVIRDDGDPDIIPGGSGSTYSFTMPGCDVTVTGEFEYNTDAAISVIFENNFSEVIDLTKSTTNNLRAGDSFTVTIAGEYDRIDNTYGGNFGWGRDGNVYTIYIYSSTPIGNQSFTVVVIKDGVPYSKEVYFRVVR